MPVMCGIEATTHILNFYQEKANSEGKQLNKPYIVACTANPSKEEEKRCLNSGMTHFLDKPPPEEDLKKVLEGIFGSNLYKIFQGKQQGHISIKDNVAGVCGVGGCLFEATPDKDNEV